MNKVFKYTTVLLFFLCLGFIGGLENGLVSFHVGCILCFSSLMLFFISFVFAGGFNSAKKNKKSSVK